MTAIQLHYDVDNRTVGRTNPNLESEAIIARTIRLDDDGAWTIIEDKPAFGPRRYVPADELRPYIHAYDDPQEEPTAEQRRALARWHLGMDRPEGAQAGLNAHLCRWAFAGLAPQQVAEIAGYRGKLLITA